MARIVSKLNLNKTPGLVENNSLIYAKNIKLLDDGSIGRDDGISQVNLNLSDLESVISDQLDELSDKIDEHNTIISNLRQELFNASPKGVIINYIQDKINDDPSSLNFPDIASFEDNPLVELYEIGAGQGTETSPYIKTNFVNSSNDFKTFIGESYLKLPIFPDYFFNFIRTEVIEDDVDKRNQVEYFCYKDWDNVTKQLKIDNAYSDFYSDYFTEIKDNGDNHIRVKDEYDDWYHEYYALVCYFNWFLYNHGNNISELINAAKDIDTEEIQNRILYYLDILEKEQSKYASLENLYESVTAGTTEIVGVIPYNTCFFVFINQTYEEDSCSFILKYDEETKQCEFCNVDWRWSGGTITGNVTINLKGQTILNIGEYKDDETLIPFKSINLDIANYDYDPSIYTQTPIIPLTNLKLYNTYTKQIPNGTYQFFIRYRITDKIYTKWTPASNVLFSGNVTQKSTIGGTIRYCDPSTDSNKSFIFSFEHVNPSAVATYKDFQLGFILTHDDTTVARSWKHFSFNTDYIYFDYDKNFIEEIPIEDLLEYKYNIYNVRNITSFKNKLYISNYKESDFNPDFVNLAKSVNVQLDSHDRADVSELNSFTYIQGGVVNTKFIETEVDENSGIYYMTSIRISNNEYKYISDIVTELMTDSNIRNIIENSGASEGLVETATTYGITLTAKVEEVVSDSGGYFTYGGNFGNIYDFRVNNFNDLIDAIDGGLSYGCISSGELTGSIYDYLSNPRILHYTGTNRIEISLKFTFNKDDVKIFNSNLVQETTLIPNQSYKFFIHYVKNTGEITNGYIINNGEEVTVELSNEHRGAINNHYIIYPKFSNIVYPEGYNSCFISIAKSRGVTAELFKVKRQTFNGQYVTTAHCLELDTRLISLLEGIPVTYMSHDSNNSTFITTSNTNKYYPSYDCGDVRFIGCTGKVNLSISDISSLDKAFVTLTELNNEDKLTLIKCTPFISGTSHYEDFTQMNLLGYICSVTKLSWFQSHDEDRFDGIYISGNDIYTKNFINNTGTLQLQLNKSTASWYNSYVTSTYTIYSNFNLNYISLATTIRDVIRTEGSGSYNSNLLSLPQSLELSDMFKLENMYKDITQKTYLSYNKESIVVFNNTIRSSNVLGDESSNESYIFPATDYYNVPTNKGKIVNLCALGNFIIVHTEDSMFKFTGNNTISSGGGEDIALKESNVFDTGVSEVFGSNYGFGGLADKSHALALPETYIFYDKDGNELYAYSGQGQINKISEPIEKLMKSAPIINIMLAGDYSNNRIFINILFQDSRHTTFVNLSYNIKTGGFTSLHNFSFKNAFNTKTKCYFLDYELSNIYCVDSSVIGYGGLTYFEGSYPDYKFYVEDDNDNNESTEYRYAAIVDIIINQNIETIKTLNAVNWIISAISYFRYRGFVPRETLFLAEEVKEGIYSGDKIRIYTDTCSTTLLDISEKGNDYDINNPNYFMLPRYNQGIWTFNYFRDINNIGDEFDYMTSTQKGEDSLNSSQSYPQNVPVNQNYSDNHSLIEGKYFVVRFVLDPINNFKLENISLSYNNKFNYE